MKSVWQRTRHPTLVEFYNLVKRENVKRENCDLINAVGERRERRERERERERERAENENRVTRHSPRAIPSLNLCPTNG